MCGVSTNQQWTFTASSAAAGKYIVKSVSSGLCLSDKDGSTAGGNPIVQETCADIARMQWSFNHVGGATATAGPPPTSGRPTVAAQKYLAGTDGWNPM
ncbi:RICIN domain-containing protein [Dactylosporangium sp. NPDC050588]|uniref:RICIN domain-containing protein n=1 Tax=Dactylosporangium sp. NPDC050588 TaxID=3157211 RepID=UPI0033E5767B